MKCKSLTTHCKALYSLDPAHLPILTWLSPLKHQPHKILSVSLMVRAVTHFVAPTHPILPTRNTFFLSCKFPCQEMITLSCQERRTLILIIRPHCMCTALYVGFNYIPATTMSFTHHISKTKILKNGTEFWTTGPC